LVTGQPRCVAAAPGVALARCAEAATAQAGPESSRRRPARKVL